MNIDSLESVQQEFEHFKKEFENGDKEKSAKQLEGLLQALENHVHVKKAGNIDKNNVITVDNKEDDRPLTISLNHIMEYYIYAYYYKITSSLNCSEIPFVEYYRTYGQLCIELSKFNAAEEAFKNAIQWNPVDLDSMLGLAEVYRYNNKLGKFLDMTKQLYRYCCTRATMARYYRNMGFYYLSKYKPEVARACYLYSNIYYETDNAKNELAYLETALQDKTPELTILQMQEIFKENDIEPGPNPDTIGVIYRVGELMMQDHDYTLAKDCFMVVYDITREEKLEGLLHELEKI
jgi:tetratricopeptide (TPR) repeat protein